MFFVRVSRLVGATRSELTVIVVINGRGGFDANLSADAMIKVPQMAESITEGTLKQFSKRTPGCVAQFSFPGLQNRRGRRLRRTR